MIRVFIVDDRPEQHPLLIRMLGQDRRFELLGCSSRGEDALRLVARDTVDVVLLRWAMAGTPAAIRRLSAHYAIPVIAMVESDFQTNEGLALRQGAVSAFPYPSQQLGQSLCDHVASMSQVRIIRRKLTSPCGSDCAAVGVVASTGGPAAMAEILKGLAPDFPAPILLVQHITAEFFSGFVSWLDENSPLPVRLAENEGRTEPGQVYVAPPNLHLHWEGQRIRLRSGQPECGQCPSGNVMLRSLAASGLPTVGVVLTGLGEDGASGLLALRQAGCHTLAQDRATSAIYGMPAAAGRLGGVTEELPLSAIAPRLIQLTRQQV